MDAEDEIKELVSRFAEEIVALADQAREESLTAVLKLIEGKLADTAVPSVPEEKVSPRRRPRAARAGSSPVSNATALEEVPTASASAEGGPGRRRTARRGPTASTASTAQSGSAPEEVTSEPAVSMASATPSSTEDGRTLAPGVSASPVDASEPTLSSSSTAPAPSSSSTEPAASGFSTAPAEALNPPKLAATDREVAVLEALGFLTRATAAEIAARCGLPNGSVAVALRALVARGVVTRAETAKGIEYGLVASASS